MTTEYSLASGPLHIGETVAAQMSTGSVTMMFSDIEGSTRLLTLLGPRYATAPPTTGACGRGRAE